MQLIQSVLIAVAVLVILAGLSVFLGATKAEKGSALRFFLATLGAAFWTIAIAAFFALSPTTGEYVHPVVVSIIAGAVFCDVFLLAYFGWSQKGGKLATMLFAVVGIAFIVLLFQHPELFYSSVDLSNEYSHIFVTKGWYYYALIVYFFLISFAFSGYLSKRISDTTNRGARNGLRVFQVGLSIGGILALVFDLILLTDRPDLAWIGPTATSISILTAYYSIVKFRMIPLSLRWIKIMSYLILAATTIIIYILIFYTVFTALFHVASPSIEVIALNLIMAAILLLLLPAISEFMAYMRTAVVLDEVNLAYILKKLERIDKASFDPRDIAGFLADCLHYSYIALIINERIYPSATMKISGHEVAALAKLHPKAGELWVAKGALDKDVAKKCEISRVGVLRDEDGKEIGKIVFGKKETRIELSRRDLIKYTTIVEVLATVVEENSKR